jgi:predicted transposase YbfD/YdcC
VAIDGKTLRRRLDRATNKAAIQMVNAWAAGNGLALGQLRTEADSNEITAVPRLLSLLEVSGCLVTLDAMGCQRATVAQIVEKGADYVLPVKDNQPTLLQEVRTALAQAIATDFEGVETHDYAESEEKAHGRHERRQVWCMKRPDNVDSDELWEGLCSIAKIRRTRTQGEKTSVEDSYYISSVLGKDAKKLMDAIRAHWSVENQLHWRLDVQFDEDGCRARIGNAAENLDRLRQMTLNLLQRDKTVKAGIKTKRLRAGWDHNYLLRVLGL